MSNSQSNNKSQNHPQQNDRTSGKMSQQSHFVQAQKIIDTWPEWKRNVCFAATSSKDNLNNSSDKK